MCDYATEDINDALIILSENIAKLEQTIQTLTDIVASNKKKISFLMDEMRK